MAEYIEREAVLEAVKQEREYVGKYSFEEEHAWAVGFQQGVTFALSDISAIPAADVAPVRHGKWVEIDPQSHRLFWECSECKRRFHDVMWNYCPFCGALMEADHE